MHFEDVRLADLVVNRANDRHGELENETAAIAELFRLREQHMRALAADIVSEGRIYDPPLVALEEGRFTIYDGNRRITCLKLIIEPRRAPSQELQQYFAELHDQWQGEFPERITCQVVDDRGVIDSILYRRHTGAQGGVGQSTWDDRAKHNFVERTGRGGRVDVAVEIERLLEDAERLPQNRIPRSTLNRLLSSEVNRNRVGVSVAGNRFSLTHTEDAVLNGLARISEDLAAGRVVLGDLWDNEGKLAYLNRLEAQGLLPREADALPAGQRPMRRPVPRRGRPQARRRQATFIPADAVDIAWRGDQGRARAIWDELRWLQLDRHPNAISALVRILLELSVTSYNASRNVGDPNDTLDRKFRGATQDLLGREIIDREYANELDRMRQNTELISIRSMHRYVHSETFAPLPDELVAFWTRLGRFVVACLSH